MPAHLLAEAQQIDTPDIAWSALSPFLIMSTGATLLLAIGGLLFFAGLFYWGGKFRTLRRTSIIIYGIIGGAVMLGAFLAINHAAGWPIPAVLALVAIGAAGLFVLAGATPAAIGLLADMTEAYPDDRGAIMGLYSVFLGLGQIFGSLVGGEAAQRAGLDGIFVASFVLLAIALLPISRLRRYEHRVGSGPVRLDGRASGAADA